MTDMTSRRPPRRRQAAGFEIGRSELLQTLARPIVFEQPIRFVSPDTWLEHIPFAFWLVEQLRPEVIVELGTQSGNSYSAFAQAVQFVRLPTACYAVDTWKGDPQTGFYDEDVFREWSHFHDRHFESFSHLVRSTFDDARDHFPDASIDLLHIDGLHSLEVVAHDFQTWLSAMNPGGIVLFHDINVRERDFGVWSLWDELREAYPTFEFRHAEGLGVLGIGDDFPEAIGWLLDLRPKQPQLTRQVREFFTELGSAIKARYVADVARDEVLRDRDAALATLNARIEEVDELLRQRESTVADGDGAALGIGGKTAPTEGADGGDDVE